MKAMIILVGIECFFLLRGLFDSTKVMNYEIYFGFFTFLGLAFLAMNIFNTTFPSMHLGNNKNSINGITKENLKSVLDKDNTNKPIVLFSKTNLLYLVFFMINAIVLTIITVVKY